MTGISNFNESRPEFQGFTRFHNEEIYPYLLAREQERKAKANKALYLGGGTGLAIMAIGVYLFFKSGTAFFLIFFGIAAIGAAIAIGYGLLSKLRAETKDFLMSHICKFLGWTYSVKGFTPPDLAPWLENRLLAHYDRVKFEDQMSGEAHGTNFTFCEAHLERRDRDSDGDNKWVTVFRGVMMEIGFHQKFLGKTVVLRDKKFFNAKKFAGMKRVGLVDQKFENLFEAYGTDQVEARVLLTPTFMQRLIDLEEQVDGKKARFGFWGDKLYIAVEAPSQFEAGSMFKPLTDPARVQKILTEIDAIYHVIDGVLKPLKRAY